MSFDTKFLDGKIYAIKSNQTNDIYYGSTAKKKLSERFNAHTYDYRKKIENSKKYCCACFEILKYPDAYIELVEEFPCYSRKELQKREGEIIFERECLNKKIPQCNELEYIEKKRIKKNRLNNRKFICDCGMATSVNNFARHKRSQKHLSLI